MTIARDAVVAPSRADTQPYTLTLTSSAVFVAQLDRSVKFYSEFMGCTVSVREPDAALLLTPTGFEIYLVGRGDRATHELDGIGNQGLMWSTRTAGELLAFADALKSVGAYVDTHEEGGVTFVEGRDPDGLRIVVAHPGPDLCRRTIIASRFYA